MGATAAAVCCQHATAKESRESVTPIDDDEDQTTPRQTPVYPLEVSHTQEEKLEASQTLSTVLPESIDVQSEAPAIVVQAWAEKQVTFAVDPETPVQVDEGDDPRSSTASEKLISKTSSEASVVSNLLEKSLERTTPEALRRTVAELGDIGEWAAAEAHILAALNEHPDDQQHLFWNAIARDANVKKTLVASRILMEARDTLPRPPEKLWEKIQMDTFEEHITASTASRHTVGSIGSRASTAKSDALGFPGWTGLAPVRLDMKSLVKAPPEYFRGLDTSAKLFWRYEENSLQIKILCQLPTDHPTLPKSWPLAIISMLSEVDLMSAFNPVVSAPPQLVRPQTKDFCTWKEQVKIRFVMSEVSIQEMTRLFTEDGLIVLKIAKVSNTSDSRVQELHVPSGYKYTEGADESITVLCVSDRQFTSVSTVQVPLPQGYRIPSWLLNFILSWVFPTMIRKMAKVASTIFSNPEYVRRFEADEVGLYARVTKAVADAKEYERKTGRSFNAYSPVTRPRSDSFKAGTLSQRVATFKALAS